MGSWDSGDEMVIPTLRLGWLECFQNGDVLSILVYLNPLCVFNTMYTCFSAPECFSCWCRILGIL